ncbi:MAG: hypothetical protein AAFO91_18890 [Bacteroidota bacterium]
MIWWVILTFTWLLAAAFKWGNEPIEKYSCYYHAVGWLIPALQTITVLIIGRVEGDNLTGVKSALLAVKLMICVWVD